MQKELDEYNELFTPFEWTYSPYTEMWYKDGVDSIPEFPVNVDNNTFKIAHYLNFEPYMNSIDNYDKSIAEKEFSDYIEYLFGLPGNGNDCFSISIFFIADNSKSKEICISETSLISLEEFINEIEIKDFAQLYLEQFSGVKIFAWIKPDNKIHLAIQKYPVYEYKKLKKEDFQLLFNVVIDKDVFIKQVKDMVNHYKEKCKNAILKFQREHLDMKLTYYDETFSYWVLKDIENNRKSIKE